MRVGTRVILRSTTRNTINSIENTRTFTDILFVVRVHIINRICVRIIRSVDLTLLEIFVGRICRCGRDRNRHKMCARRRNRTSQAFP